MRGYACIAMDNPKDLNNIGGAMRAMHCYGAKLLVVGGDRVRSLGGIATDTFKTVRHVPVIRADDVLDALPFDCVTVAVDLLPGATPLPNYQHPERASTSSAPRTRRWARGSPTGAATASTSRPRNA